MDAAPAIQPRLVMGVQITEKKITKSSYVIKDAFVISVAKGSKVTLSQTWSESVSASVTHAEARTALKLNGTITKTYTKTQSFTGPPESSSYNSREYRVKFYVEDGTYNFHMTVIQLGDSSKAYVNGGTYLDPVEYNNRYYTLNLIDGCDGKFYVRGGTFESYDPSNSDSENHTANFIDEGFKDTSRVVEEDGTTVTYYDVVIDE